METFDEFDQPNLPQKTSGDIISHAFETYKSVIGYAILAMVIYLLASVLIQSLSGFNSRDFSSEIMNSTGNFGDINVWAIPGMTTYYGLSGLLGILVAPLYVGIIYMANKSELKEKLEISDLFIGYRQNFVNILLYGLISSIILGFSFAMCLIPGFFVLPLLLLGYPILLFENASFSEALSKSFNIAKENYGVFLGASFLGLLISFAGIILCGIGIIATAPFMLIVMYSTYCAFCGRPRALLSK